MSGINSINTMSALARIGNHKQKNPFRVMVLGQSAVGKTALIVRFITRRFIGEYDKQERIYPYSCDIDDEVVNFEILDSFGQLDHDEHTLQLEANIRWAEAFILMYSVTDKCSFEEVNRLKFLINYCKKQRRRMSLKEDFLDFPVILVANKIDQEDDRVISKEEGQTRSQEIGCACYHEISVREELLEIDAVFRDVCRFWKFITKFPKLRRSKSDSMRMSMTLHSDSDPDRIITKLYQMCHNMHDEKRKSVMLFGRSWSAWHEENENDELDTNEPFRSRAKTDGNLLMSRSRRWKIPTPRLSPPVTKISASPPVHAPSRRNSISMRGHVSY